MVTDPWKSLDPRKNARYLLSILLTYGTLDNLAGSNPVGSHNKHAPAVCMTRCSCGTPVTYAQEIEVTTACHLA